MGDVEAPAVNPDLGEPKLAHVKEVLAHLEKEKGKIATPIRAYDPVHQ